MNPIYDDATDTKPRPSTDRCVSNPGYDMTIAANRMDSSISSSPQQSDNPLYESSTQVTQGENPIYEGYEGSPPMAQPGSHTGMNPIYDGLPADYCGGPPAEAYGKTNPNPEYESLPSDATSNPIYEMGYSNPAVDPIYAEANNDEPCYEAVTGSNNTGSEARINPIYEESSFDSTERKPRSLSLNRSEPTYSKLSDDEANHSDDSPKGLRKRTESKSKMYENQDEVPFRNDYDNEGLNVMNELYGTTINQHDKTS